MSATSHMSRELLRQLNCFSSPLHKPDRKSMAARTGGSEHAPGMASLRLTCERRYGGFYEDLLNL